MNYITQERLNKKLCIDCRHVVLGMDRPKCGYFRSKVDDSPKDYAQITRDFDCKGIFWKSKDFIIVKDENEAARLRNEDFINDFMDFARKVVRGEAKLSEVTCGGLEEAIRRAKLELEEEIDLAMRAMDKISIK